MQVTKMIDDGKWDAMTSFLLAKYIFICFKGKPKLPFNFLQYAFLRVNSSLPLFTQMPLT